MTSRRFKSDCEALGLSLVKICRTLILLIPSIVRHYKKTTENTVLTKSNLYTQKKSHTQEEWEEGWGRSSKRSWSLPSLQAVCV